MLTMAESRKPLWDALFRNGISPSVIKNNVTGVSGTLEIGTCVRFHLDEEHSLCFLEGKERPHRFGDNLWQFVKEDSSVGIMRGGRILSVVSHAENGVRISHAGEHDIPIVISW